MEIEIFGHKMELDTIITVMRDCLRKKGDDIFLVEKMECGTQKSHGYWIFHVGSDYFIYEITDACAHYETAYAVARFIGIEFPYESFFTQGITRAFADSRELSLRCGKYNLDDVKFICAMQEDFYYYSIGVYEIQESIDNCREIKSAYMSKEELLEQF